MNNLGSEKDIIFNGIKNRMKTWYISQDHNPDEMMKIAEKSKKPANDITVWDFLNVTYLVTDQTSIQSLIYFLAFENTVVNNTNQYVIKMLTLLSQIEGGNETEKNSLQLLFEKDEVNASQLISGK